ncbi:MAG: hypothetical protein AUJ85_02745 [Elusimicrobia bacterium CG1_02_37_114]|nr:MAG: hypothetical protein AUJ85_02745 [Elusimicrobia bacterium CG1_02_37_114]PIV54131.1 MAG: hypothetical protein COS17_00235 [Elusimicrobia bacterium CG02_land_8_20_14_3_00_37_13]
MRWLAPWLAEAYSKLYNKHKTEKFDFDTAMSILNKSKKSVTKILNELEDRGFLISKRNEIDKRKRFYRLIPIEKVIEVYGEGTESNDPIEKLKTTTIPYVLTGNYASYLYTKYANPAKIEISVFKNDVETSIAYLKSKNIAIAVDDMLAEGRNVIHIFTDLTEERFKDRIRQEGLSLEQIERLTISLLKRKDAFGLTDCLSLLLTKKINWRKLVNLAKESNLLEEVGLLLEIVNTEIKKRIFSKQLIQKIEQQSSKPRKELHVRIIRKDLFSKKEEIPYQDIGKKWNIDVVISRALITKVIEDLIR